MKMLKAYLTLKHILYSGIQINLQVRQRVKFPAKYLLAINSFHVLIVN